MPGRSSHRRSGGGATAISAAPPSGHRRPHRAKDNQAYTRRQRDEMIKDPQGLIETVAGVSFRPGTQRYRNPAAGCPSACQPREPRSEHASLHRRTGHRRVAVPPVCVAEMNHPQHGTGARDARVSLHAPDRSAREQGASSAVPGQSRASPQSAGCCSLRRGSQTQGGSGSNVYEDMKGTA